MNKNDIILFGGFEKGFKTLIGEFHWANEVGWTKKNYCQNGIIF